MKTKTQPRTSKNQKLLVHIVEVKNGKPSERCLCGYLWDTLQPKIGDICEDCLDEVARREAEKN